ncbi:hypothetical protein KIPB_007506, partial [Kipferlia bialata]|eukprot:g7506.t1
MQGLLSRAVLSAAAGASSSITRACVNALTCLFGLITVPSLLFDEALLIGQCLLGVLSFLGMLCDLNDRSHLIPHSLMYNDAVNTQYNLSADHIRFLRQEDNFSFLRYPFVLSAYTKARLLRREAKMQQRTSAGGMFMMGQPVFSLKVRRESLIEDTVRTIEFVRQSRPATLRYPLKVTFAGEPGIDQGGVSTEFFTLVTEALFDPTYGMFVYNQDTRVLWFNPHSTAFAEMMSHFYLIGAILGLAIYNGVNVDTRLPQVTYKRLLGMEVGLEDIRDIDPTLHRSLEVVLECPPEQVEGLCMTFAVENDWVGHTYTTELVPGGGDVNVTADNRQEYVEKYVE